MRDLRERGRHKIFLAAFTPSDSRVLLFFDTIHSFAEGKTYEESELSRLSAAFGGERIINIKDMMDARDEHAASSRDFAKRLMNWMVKESRIDHREYFADIADSREAKEGSDRFSIFHKIRAQSTFEAGIKSCSDRIDAEPRELAGKSGFPSGIIKSAATAALASKSRAARA